MKTYKLYREFIHDLAVLVTSVILLIGFSQSLSAQSKSDADKGRQMTLYPGITGQQLLDSLTTNHKTTSVLSYNAARDTLYGRVFNVDDSLSGVYSLFTIYVDPSSDPSTDAFNKGINAEHTWPQSKGAGSGTPRSDMHNLRPARIQVNSARANYPFGESDDLDTDSWFRRDQQLNTIPGSLIDEYTEVDNDGNVFEPREAYKGDVARTMFYFYTMYRTEADNADPNFFDIQKETFLSWHRQDPPDSTESARSDSISHWQDGLGNPFIQDTSLAARAYFTGSITAAPSPLLITAIGPDTLELSWSLPIGYEASDNELLLLCQSGSIVNDDPTGAPVSSYTADETLGNGSEVGSGSFVVYKGDSTNAIIRGLTTGTVYHFSMWNTLSNTTYATTPTQINTTTSSGGTSSPGDVIISEIMKNPQVVSDSDGEWFELFNATNSPIDINGWTISDDGIDTHVINNGSALIIPALGFIVLARNSDFNSNGGVTVDYQYTSYFLANSADEIVLLDSDGTTEIDRVNYDGSVQSSGSSGASMVFTGEASDDNNDLSFWQVAFTAWPNSSGDLGSPGFGGTDQALPVQLSTFSAMRNAGRADICWATDSEIDNVGFILSRSASSSGPWQTIADYTSSQLLIGAGTSNDRNEYCFEDINLPDGIDFWYRLQAVDTRGVISTFPAAKLSDSNPTGLIDQFELYNAYPNPFNGQSTTRFNLPEEGPLRIQLYNTLGQLVRVLFEGRLSGGEHSVQWDGLTGNGSEAGSGRYFLQISYAEQQAVQALVLQR